MSTFREAVENRVVSSLVEGVDRADRLAGLLVNSIPAAPALRNAINGLLALLGNLPGDSDLDDIAPRPFQGGQCETVYDVSYTRGQISSTSTCAETTVSLTSGVSGPFTFQRGGGLPGDPSGNYDAVLNRNGQPSISAQWNESDDCPYTGFRILSIDAVVRRDGGADDCGNPPRDLPVPSGGIPPEPAAIEYINRDGVTVNVDGDVSYGPSFTNNGVIVIPFIYATANVRLTGQIGLDGTIELTPEISVNPGGDEPVLGGENDGENPTEEGEEGDIIIGVQVKTLDSTGRLTEIGSTVGPDITAPRAASVMFLLDDGEIGGWSVDYDVKNTDCLIEAPSWLPCTAVSVTPAEGVTIAWRAIYGQRLITEEED